MAKEFGVLVDYEGYFLAALSWDDTETPPEFNRPRKGEETIRPEDKKHLLRSPAALLVDDPMSRWDFKNEVWEIPNEKFWIVNQQGTVIGGRTYWPERPPTAKPGTEITFVAPPETKRGRARAIWDSSVGQWKPNRVVALVDEDGIVDNMVLENPRPDTEDVALPPNWEREDDDGGLVNDSDGEPLRLGSIKDQLGVFHFCAFVVTKARIETWLANRGHEAAWQTYLEGRNLWDRWLEFPSDHPINLVDKGRIIIGFLKSLGFTRDQIINGIRNQIRE